MVRVFPRFLAFRLALSTSGPPSVGHSPPCGSSLNLSNSIQKSETRVSLLVVCVRARVCMRACVRACICVGVGVGFCVCCGGQPYGQQRQPFRKQPGSFTRR
jgi:hypothetical protein